MRGQPQGNPWRPTILTRLTSYDNDRQMFPLSRRLAWWPAAYGGSILLAFRSPVRRPLATLLDRIERAMIGPFLTAEASREYFRLRGLESAFDIGTLRVLDELGVAPGWRCLEVAAGTGSIALGLQLRAGSVAAVDIDAQFIRHLEAPNFTVLEGSVEDVELPGDLDLVHARFLLDLLPDPQATIRRLYSSLRPGGWLFLEEFDDVTLNEAWGSDEAVALHKIVLAGKHRGWNKKNWDNYLGRKLPEWMIDMGLADVDSQCACRVRRSGTREVAGWLESLKNFRGDVEPELPPGVLDQYFASLQTPGFTYMSPLVVRSYGRSPVD